MRPINRNEVLENRENSLGARITVAMSLGRSSRFHQSNATPLYRWLTSHAQLAECNFLTL